MFASLSVGKRIAISASLLSIGAALLATAQNVTWCSGATSLTPQARIGACTRIIDFGDFLRLDLARFFNNRGRAYSADRDYGRAIADFDEAIRRDPNFAIAFNNRGIAHMTTLEFERALADYDQAVKLNSTLLYARKNRGYTQLLNANYASAAVDLAEVAQQQPRDVYPALWLFIARMRAGERNALPELESNTKALKPGDWPRPAVDLFLGRVTPDAARSAARTADERCEADFYVGVWHAISGDRTAALRLYRTARDTCPHEFIERVGAHAELKRLAP